MSTRKLHSFREFSSLSTVWDSSISLTSNLFSISWNSLHDLAFISRKSVTPYLIPKVKLERANSLFPVCYCAGKEVACGYSERIFGWSGIAANFINDNQTGFGSLRMLLTRTNHVVLAILGMVRVFHRKTPSTPLWWEGEDWFYLESFPTCMTGLSRSKQAYLEISDELLIVLYWLKQWQHKVRTCDILEKTRRHVHEVNNLYGPPI